MSSCILYTGYINVHGYGVQQRNYVRAGAHRWAYIDTFGPIPEGMCVLHKCDVRTCVNPEHLFLGTSEENVQDMVQKGRQKGPQGSDQWSNKLTEQDVLEIRNSNESCHALARRFGVWPTQISRIKRRLRWAWL